MFRASLIIYLTLIVACQAGFTPVVQWPVDEYRPVPFTDFDTEQHEITLEFLANKLQARLRVDGETWTELPEKILPLKVVDTPNDRLLLIGMELFSGNLSMFSASFDGSGLTRIDLPSALTYSLFKQAVVFDGYLMIILYNVHTLNNDMYRWKLSEQGTPIVTEDNYWHLQFDGRYEVDANIFMAEYQDELYFVGEGVLYRYAKDGILNRTELPGNLSIVEMSLSPTGIAGLFQDEDLLTTPFTNTTGIDPFQIFDLQPEIPIEIATEESYTLPFHLRYNERWEASDGTTPQALAEMLTYDLSNRTPSGVYNLGSNNFEGRVAWSQVYYLNGIIDLVKEWENEIVNFEFLGNLRDDLKLRLDLEMYLLDRLLDAGNPGMLSSRYSVERQPVIHAVQTGRIVRLFKRYVLEVNNPLSLANYDDFLDTTRNLEDHIEVLEKAGEGNPEALPEQYYLKWPKGSAFWADGTAIPYNHQNDWAGGVAYSAPEDSKESIYLSAARDIVTIFLTNEQFYSVFPADYLWRYNWGKLWSGWTSNDDVSVNTPDFAGSRSPAHISYRSIDGMAVLSVGHLYPEILPDGITDYLKNAVQENGVYPFVTEELLKYNVYPDISPALAAQYVRVKSPWELQNSIWALLALHTQMNQ